MWITPVACIIASLIACTACSDSKTTAAGPDAGAADTGAPIDAGADPSCGDGTCQAGENCLTCPGDCACRCGDGLCTLGEFCASCPADCDCVTLAATPPMGWNSWNKFHCQIDEAMIREIADAMVSSGMKDAGYTFLNLDDCWQASRDASGAIVADAALFPSGIPALADYVHARGLKFGLYTCAGTMTCQSKPGSFGHEAQDAATYAAWNVDYVKVDWCFTDGMDPKERYTAMHDGIQASGGKIVFSLCNWGVDDPWVWGPALGQLWRTTGDIWDDFEAMLGIFDATLPLAPFASIGHWNDPDMLEVGNGLMTRDEYKAHMSLWAILAAPLIAGNDLRAMTDGTKDILLNPEVIAVDQDPEGLPGVKVAEDEAGLEVYARPVTKAGSRAVVLFNRTATTREMAVRWADLGLAPGKAAVRDLWRQTDLGTFADSFSETVKSHGVVMVLVTGAELKPPADETALSAHPWMHAANFGGAVAKDAADLVVGPSVIVWNLGGACTGFKADAAIDAAAGPDATVTFEAWADGAKLYDSGMMKKGDPVKPVDVTLTGKRQLKLVVTPAGDRTKDDLAKWGNARIECR